MNRGLEKSTWETTERLHQEVIESICKYQSRNLFNSLYHLDIAKINVEIQELKNKFYVEYALITDTSGIVLTDGTPENSSYGTSLQEAVSALKVDKLKIYESPDGGTAIFAISSGNEIAGYGKILFSHKLVAEITNQQKDLTGRAVAQTNKTFLIMMVAGCSFIVALLIPLFMLLSRRLTAPLILLKESADRVAAGDLECRSAVQQDNEIGDLANAFNKMAAELCIARDSLLSYSGELEKQVVDRTSELQYSENRFRAMYESATDAIMMLDENGFFDCNVATLSMFGLSSKEEFTRLHPSQISPQQQPDGLDSLTAANEKISVAFEKGSNFFEWVHQRANGEDFFADVMLTAFYYDEKQVLQATVRDITARKQIEAEIVKLNQDLEQRVAERTRQLEESNKELESFAYVVSHDLKAPLRAITSLSNWLAADYGDKLDKEGQETLDLLVQRTARMNGLIDGILNYSRVGRISEESTSVDLTMVVNEVIDLLAPPEEVAVTIETPLPTVVCEKTRIYQLFQNLLSNAVKHLDKPNGEIRVGCRDEEPGAKGKKTKGKKQVYAFYVSDNGPGIEEKYFDKIFQMFQTLKPRDEVENTGVGLTIAKKIVEMYGGTIWVESRIGEGSTFWFTLPYTVAEGAEAGGDSLQALPKASLGGGGL
ncbi:MAG: PAS domain S-box protein [Deltaproteobacteria bacterium]|nr:PAS domain S-box protein [Deltaproteobacteria bacterium]